MWRVFLATEWNPNEIDGNRVIGVLGELLGGTDIGRLSMTVDPAILYNADDAKFYIDDTSVIVRDIFKGN